MPPAEPPGARSGSRSRDIPHAFSREGNEWFPVFSAFFLWLSNQIRIFPAPPAILILSLTVCSGIRLLLRFLLSRFRRFFLLRRPPGFSKLHIFKKRCQTGNLFQPQNLISVHSQMSGNPGF